MQRLPRHSKLLILAALLMPGLLLQSCENSHPTLPSQEPVIDLSATPRENQEAEEAALWLSGKLLAPDSLYRIIKGELAVIRAMYTFEAPIRETTRRTPFNWYSKAVCIRGASRNATKGSMASPPHGRIRRMEFSIISTPGRPTAA